MFVKLSIFDNIANFCINTKVLAFSALPVHPSGNRRDHQGHEAAQPALDGAGLHTVVANAAMLVGGVGHRAAAVALAGTFPFFTPLGAPGEHHHQHQQHHHQKVESELEHGFSAPP